MTTNTSIIELAESLGMDFYVSGQPRKPIHMHQICEFAGLIIALCADRIEYMVHNGVHNHELANLLQEHFIRHDTDLVCL